MSGEVMIVAGEASGELYGARLAEELVNRYPGMPIFGMGGPRMESAGVELLRTITPVVGIVEVISHLSELRESFRTLTGALRARRPDILVLIDFPDFNLRLAKEARREGIPVLYYVSPQIWAWRRGRLRTIAERANAMAVILPFEEDLYRDAGMRCEYVGHPLMEELDSFQTSREEARLLLGLAEGETVVALLPGSRAGEIRRHWPVLAVAAKELKLRVPDVRIVVPLAPGLPEEARSMIESGEEGFLAVNGMAREVLRAADAAAVASGTAVLEAALIGTPSVVFYRGAMLSYLIARFLVDLPYISLPNLITGKPLLKELIQREMRPELIVRELLAILESPNRRAVMLEGFRELGRILGTRRATAAAADLVAEVAGW